MCHRRWARRRERLPLHAWPSALTTGTVVTRNDQDSREPTSAAGGGSGPAQGRQEDSNLGPCEATSDKKVHSKDNEC